MRNTICVLLMGALAGCGSSGGLGATGNPDATVRVEGEAARDTAQSGVATVIGAAISPQGASGFSSGTPSSVQPPADFFADAPAAKNGLATAQQPTSQLSAWQGPESGPDGKDGWYRRILTWSYPDTTGTDVTQVSSLWARAEPAHDFKANGFANLSMETLHYAWTADEGFWKGATWLMSFTFKGAVKLPGGDIVPGGYAGQWSWDVPDDAQRYAGSHAEGSYRLTNALHEIFFHPSDAVRDELVNAGTGKTWDLAADGIWEMSYSGEYFDLNNDPAGTWFGGGQGTNMFAATITKTGADTLSVFMDLQGDSVYYWASGTPQSGTDYFAEPDYSATVTPPGAIWGEFSNDNQGGNGKDGLLFWTESSFWSKNSSGAKITADGQFTEDPAVQGVFTSYNRTRSLSAAGGTPIESVYCSDPSVASDCPATTQ
ncbi:MAG: hypothetical protein D6761_08995 [Candidatus Dadabacteria bacterium]|nr:MAG: hypothetical protein D6761_08995 [Candidatus Dadabacteria bacterium]